MKSDNQDMMGMGMPNWGAMDQDQPKQTGRILLMLRGRYHWAIILASVFGIAGGLAGFYKNSDEYMSAGQVQIRSTRSKIIYDVEDQMQSNNFDAYMESQVALMKSPQVIDVAIRDPKWRKAFGELPKKQSLQIIRESLEIEHPRRSELIDLYFTNSTPERAVAGVQSMLDAFKTYNKQQQDEQDATKINFVSEKETAERDAIRRLKDTRTYLIKDYGTETGLIEQHDAYRTAIYEDKIALGDLQDTIKSLVATVGDNTTPNATGFSDALVYQLAQTDPKMQLLLDQKEQAEAELENYSLKSLGPAHYNVKQAKANLTTINQKIKRYLLSGRGITLDENGLPASQVAQLKSRERLLEEEIAEKEVQAAVMADHIIQIQEINDKMAEAQQDLQDAQTRRETLVTESPVSSKISILNSGQYPFEPSNFDKRVKFAVAGSVAGMGFGIGIVLLIGMADRRLRHADDAQAGFKDVRMLGILPTLPTELNDPEQGAIAAHAVHHIRTLMQLQAKADPDSGVVYSVTGPAAGSGKTSMSIALGLSFAATGAKTLLIDCDLIAGGLTRRLNIEVNMPLGQLMHDLGYITQSQLREMQLAVNNSNTTEIDFLTEKAYATTQQIEHAFELQKQTRVGLMDVCSGLPVNNAISATDIKDLFVLPIGDAKPHHAGALSPEALRALIANVRKQFDVILVDTGPVLGSLEASIMASSVDQVVMVVSRGDQKSITFKSFEHLYTLKAKIAGVVFNHALNEDMQKTSYATMSAAQSRLPEGYKPTAVLDDGQTERFGPLASAVASYGSVKKSDSTSAA
ncbi:exopolysaccharide transport family protein [Poriferisphaera sp. WC338]|uniref:exopolysaccharide transport family protein n=1 Tax=Poriferisphaera sp. WC338 TaxID=3425129 RepID=UPI003D815F9B